MATSEHQGPTNAKKCPTTRGMTAQYPTDEPPAFSELPEDHLDVDEVLVDGVPVPRQQAEQDRRRRRPRGANKHNKVLFPVDRHDNRLRKPKGFSKPAPVNPGPGPRRTRPGHWIKSLTHALQALSVSRVNEDGGTESGAANQGHSGRGNAGGGSGKNGDDGMGGIGVASVDSGGGHGFEGDKAATQVSAFLLPLHGMPGSRD
jgi:hypothetical protein